MESVIIKGLVGPSDLIPEGEYHILGVGDPERARRTSEAQYTRNYL